MITQVIADGSIIILECDGVIGPHTCKRTKVFIAADRDAAEDMAKNAKWLIEDNLIFCPRCARPVGWADGSRHE